MSRYDHLARLEEMSGFDNFATTMGGRILDRVQVPANITIVWAHVIGESDANWRAQALKFSPHEWSADDAKAWLTANKITALSFEASDAAMADTIVMGDDGETGWIPSCMTGEYPKHNLTLKEQDFRDVEKNFAAEPAGEEVPVCFDHEEKGESLGWVAGVKAAGKKLVCKLRNVSQKLCDAVNSRKFPNRSVRLERKEDGTWRLRHLSFLGAKPPAVKGMGWVCLGDNGGTQFIDVAFEDVVLDSEGPETEITMPEQTQEQSHTVTLADMSAQYEAEVKDLEAKLSAQMAEMEAKEARLAELEAERVKLAARDREREIASFADGQLAKGQWAPAFDKMGIRTFMAQLDAAGEGDVELADPAQAGKTTKSLGAWFKGFMEKLPKIVDLSRVVDDDAQNSHLVDLKDREALDRTVKALAREKNIPYHEAKALVMQDLADKD
ncbi:MAG TPA: hypothetical protein VM487_18540 [Phycisphaerae bacterium]|nr:hypothetical protein [Phycisphaerae bacterium]